MINLEKLISNVTERHFLFYLFIFSHDILFLPVFSIPVSISNLEKKEKKKKNSSRVLGISCFWDIGCRIMAAQMEAVKLSLGVGGVHNQNCLWRLWHTLFWEVTNWSSVS